MPNSPLIPSTTARYNGLPDFPLSLFCFGLEIFAHSGMLGILIRARALLMVVFINPSGGEGPDFALKKTKKQNPTKKNQQQQKKANRKKKKKRRCSREEAYKLFPSSFCPG